MLDRFRPQPDDRVNLIKQYFYHSNQQAFATMPADECKGITFFLVKAVARIADNSSALATRF